METTINKPTEDNWINGIDKNEPWKYLWQFDAMIWEDKGWEEFSSKLNDSDSYNVNYFLDTVRYTSWFKEFTKAFDLTGTVETSFYYHVFEYLGKDPEAMMRNLTNMALLEKLNG